MPRATRLGDVGQDDNRGPPRGASILAPACLFKSRQEASRLLERSLRSNP